eukprot:4984205-Pleurochrysis_carterae.AAC.1
MSERCYLALASAVSAHRGGVVLSASGSGKLESLRSLSLAAGRMHVQCLCAADAVDWRAMRSVLRAAIGAGAWLLLARVGTLAPGVLQQLAQTFAGAALALASGQDRCMLDGAEVPLHPYFGMLATASGARHDDLAFARVPAHLRVQLRP